MYVRALHWQAGLLAVALASAQAYLLQRMRQTKYKEIAEKKLITEIRSEADQQAKARGRPSIGNGDRDADGDVPSRQRSTVECSRRFPLGLRFHLADLLGREVLTRVTAPSLSVAAAGTFDGLLRLGPAAAARGGGPRR